MFTLTQVLVSVVLLASAVWGLPLTQESAVDGLSLDLPVRFGFPMDDGNRIFGGQDASVGQFPHQVALRVLNNHICGGSIISDRFVLTAAHCYLAQIPHPFLYRVVVGAHRRNAIEGAAYEVKRWILHENANITLTNETAIVLNDIALIETVKPIAFNKVIAPIALERKFIDGGVLALTSGWGQTNDTNTNLKYVNEKTLTNTACRAILNTLSKLPAPVHDWDTLCVATAEFGHGICGGDSGGPLVVENKLIGVTSWAFGCGYGLPEGFTRVSTYIDWISEKTKLTF